MSIVSYKLSTFFDSLRKNWQISLQHNVTNAIHLCLNFTEERVADCPDYVLLFSSIKRKVPSPIRQRIYSVYTSWSFEMFLLRYPIKRHLSLKRALDAFNPVGVQVCISKREHCSSINWNKDWFWFIKFY